MKLQRFLKTFFALVVVAGCTAKDGLFSPPDGIYTFPGIGTVNIEGDGSLVLSWEQVPTEGSTYFVFRRLASEKFDWNKSFKSTTANSLEHPSFSLTQKYCFAVRFSKIGIDTDTNVSEICPTLPYIENFSGIDAATSVDTGVATISWNKPTVGMDEVEGYRVYTGTDFKTQVASAIARDSSVSVPNLTPDETYTFGVRAYDKYGREDTNTRTVSVLIINNSPPEFAGIDTAVQKTSSSIELKWLSATGKPAKYNIYKATGAANSTLTVDTLTPYTNVGAATLSKTFTDLGDELAHCFLIRAETSGGQKDANAVTKCVTLPDNGAPVFTGLQTLTFTGGGAALGWDAAVGETSNYKVYYQQGTSLDYNTAQSTIITAPATSANINGLADNRDWTFSVRAYDSHNNSDTNTIKKTATAGDLTPPTFGGYVSAAALSETSIQVIFNRSVEADTSVYKIKTRKSGTSDAFVVMATANQVSSGNVTSNLTSLLPATSYDILVTAFDTNGNPSTNSSYLTRATLDLSPPNFGGVISAAKKTTDVTKMVVTWNAATDAGGIFGYRVYYSLQSLIGKSLVRTATYPLTDGGQTIYMSSNVSSSSTSVEISGLTSNTMYYFVVHAVDAAGNEDSNTVEASALVPNFTAPGVVTGLAFSPAPGTATTNRVPYVSGTGVVGNTAFVYVDSVVAGSQPIAANGTFNIQLSLPNVSKVYAVTATQKNTDGVESSTASVGNYNLQVTAPTATLTNAPTGTTPTAALDVTVTGANATHYKWALVIAGSDCTSGTYSAFTPVATHITHTVTADGQWKLCVIAKDNLDNIQDPATQATFTLDTLPPTLAATLTNAPTGNSNSTNVDITVGGTDVTQYKYVFTTQATDCSSGSLVYSNFAAVATHITGNPGADGNIRLCVKGADAASNFAPTTVAEWVKITAAPTITSVTVSDKVTNSTTMSNVQTVNAIMTGSATLHQACFKTANSTPAAGDACWGATTQQISLATVNASNTVYGWARDALGNIQTTPTTATITWTNYCDSGTMDGACIITTTRTVASGAKLGGLGSLTVQSGGTLATAATQTSTLTFTTGNITIENGGVISGNFTITAQNVDVQSGASLNANAKGSLGDTTGNSIGSGTAPGAAGGGGGSHAGIGGFSSSAAPGGTPAYGSATQPTTLGSGGAGANGVAGGNGGGALKLVVSGTLTLEGSLTADGASIATRGAAGAGGSIWISAADFVGGGLLTAKGGDTGSSSGTWAGAGGGGRIAIYNAAHLFHGIVSVAGGQGAGNLYDSYNATAGSYYVDSTVGICDSGTLATTCNVTGNLTLSNGFAISGAGNLVIATGVTVQVLAPQDSISIAMTGDVTVNGTLLANINSLTAANVTIGASGVLSSNGLGFHGGAPGANGTGTGGGVYSATFGGGGAHGGTGGLSGSPGALGGSTYGSATNPSTAGSGGGGSSGAKGGNGGGIIKIIASNTLTNNGSISSNGMTGSTKSGNAVLSGAGAGGTVHLTANTLNGSGTISATGGAALNSGVGGAGGGGRLYISATTPFHGTGLKSAISYAGGEGKVQAGGGLFINYNGSIGSFAMGQMPCDTGSPSTTCVINGMTYLPNASTLSVPGNLEVASGGTLYNNNLEFASLSITGNLTVTGTINANLNTLTANNITVNSGAVISANGLGYPAFGVSSGAAQAAGSGPGFGTGASCGASGYGAAYGGNGGLGVGFSASAFYGSATKTQPLLFGSSGGSSNGGGGGNGGGVLRIIALGNLSNLGSITTDGIVSGGSATVGSSGGGGSGGSLWVSVTGTISGNGIFTAKGGSVSPLNVCLHGGSGSGGRIAYDTYTTNSFTGTWSAAQGAAVTNGAAGVGSICDKGAGAGCIN